MNKAIAKKQNLIIAQEIADNIAKYYCLPLYIIVFGALNVLIKSLFYISFLFLLECSLKLC